MTNGIKKKRFHCIVDGSELSLDDGHLIEGKPTQRLVRFHCLVSMRLQNTPVLCSYVDDEPMFYSGRYA